MKITSYKGPYEHSMPTRFVMDDGTVWRTAEPAELRNVAPDTEVWFGRGEPKQAGDYADLFFPGHYPYLAGMAALSRVYVRAE